MTNGCPHSHTHSEDRAPSLSARFLLAAFIVIAGAPVLPLLVAHADRSSDDPAPAPVAGTSADTPSLVESLASGDYRARESATRQLLERGEEALPALRQALESDDPEVRLRARTVIEAIAEQEAREESGDARQLARRLRDRTDARFEDTLRQLDQLFERLDRVPAPTPDRFRGRFRAFGEGWEDIEARMQELRERMHRSFEQGPPIDPFAPFEGLDAEWFGLGSGAGGEGSSRVQIWRDGAKVFDSAREHSYAEIPSLGIVLESLHPALRAHLPIGEGQGVLIHQVQENGPAAKAGLVPHDIILTAAGEPVSDAITLRKLLRGAESGTIVLGILHEGEARTVEVSLGGETY